MAKFNITEGSVKVLGGVKTAMEVTFIADDGGEVTQQHEVESVDKDVIQQELQKSADEFSAREVKSVGVPVLPTNKATQVAIL